MSIFKLTSLALLAIASTFSAFSLEARAETLGFSLSDDGTSGDIQVVVVDELTGQPLPDAVITLADALGAGERNRGSRDDLWALTDSKGTAAIRPLTSKPKSITVSKQAYSSISILGVQSNRVTVFLKRLANATPDVIASGRVDGWQARRRTPTYEPRTIGTLGKPVHVGLAFRVLNSFDLLSFNVGSVVSPLSDTIDVWGPRQIPSNIVLPRQKVPVFLGSVTVEKYNYRLPLTNGVTTRLTTMQGTIDSGDLIDIGQSGNVTPGAINKFTFTRLGLSEPVTPTANFSLNLATTAGLVPTHDVTVNPPPFQSDVLVAAVTDLTADRQSLVPTDIRAPITAARGLPRAPVAVRMRSTAQPLGASRGVVAVALSQDMKRLSGIIHDGIGAKVATGEFLPVQPLADAPQLPAQIRLSPATQGLTAAVFETAVPIPARAPAFPRASAQPKERRFPVWYVYALPGAGAVDLSTQGLPVPNSMKVRGYSLLQLEFSPDFNEHSIDGQTVMTQLRRFTRTGAKITTVRR